MKKTFLKSAVLAIAAVGLLAGSALATNLPYWQIVSTDAEFSLYDTDTVLEFGMYTVDNLTTPNADTVDLTALFNANASQYSSAQVFRDDWDVFGFYVKNVSNNRIWLSDNSITDAASGELNGLEVRTDTDRFMIDSVYGTNGDLIVNEWDFSFTKTDGETVRWMSRGSDIAPVPEPATMLLFGTGLAGLAGFARRKKAQKDS